MKTPKGRTHRAIGVSLSPDKMAFIQQRIADCQPVLRGLSHYIQILITLDQKHDLLKVESKNGRRTFTLPAWRAAGALMAA